MPKHTEQDAQTSIFLDSNGQSFIEFIFLLSTLIIIGLVMVKGFNTGIGVYWRGIVQTVVDHNPAPSIELN